MTKKHSFDRSLWVALGVTGIAVSIAACGGGGDGSGGAGGGSGGGTTSSTSSTSTTSTTGASSTSSSSSSGALNCTEITAGAFKKAGGDGTYAAYSAAPTPDQGDMKVPDDLSLEFYGSDFGGDGEATGSFDLSMSGDDNYATCSRCVLLYEDLDPSTGAVARAYFQLGGTMEIDAASDQLNGKVNATLTDVTLIEVTIDSETIESTPVDGGKCLHIASATVMVEPPVAPAEWTCDATAYGDGTCDCGCGAVDVDCASSAATDCENNQCTTGNTPDVADNSKCVPVPAEWTCDSTWYNDGTCDCGCGAVDVDCASSALTDCKSNGCPSGNKPDSADTTQCVPVPAGWLCDEIYYGDGMCQCGCGIQDSDCTSGAASECTDDACPTGVDPIDGTNWLCTGVPDGWTCLQGFYGDGDCDCGCGVVDSDCTDATAASCKYCDDKGSCSTDKCPGTIDSANNATCAAP